jgi:hypothetical protein
VPRAARSAATDRTWWSEITLHEHTITGGTPCSDRPWVLFLVADATDPATTLSWHAGKQLRKRYDMKSF